MSASQLFKIACLMSPLVACATEPSGEHFVLAAEQHSNFHKLPLDSSNDSAVGGGVTAHVAPRGAQLSFGGGRLLSNIHDAPLFWNRNVQFQATLNAFYNDVPNSPLYDMLSQYGIGRGDGQAGFVDNRAPASLTDADVQAEVLKQINLGNLPAPDDPNLYIPVHFPAGTSISAFGDQSCVQFCAYHNSFQVRSSSGRVVDVAYGVIPDQGGSCAGGCGRNARRVNNLTSVSSHELVEATTDPDPGTGWTDPRFSEIGDICNAQQGTTVGNGVSFVIQLEFSNAANDCVAK